MKQCISRIDLHKQVRGPVQWEGGIDGAVAIGQDGVHAIGWDAEPFCNTVPNGIPRGGGNDASASNVEWTLGRNVGGVFANDPAAVHGTSHHPVVATPGMVRTLPAVPGNSTSKVGRKYNRHIVPDLLCLEFAHKQLEISIEWLKLFTDVLLEVAVVIPATVVDKEHITLAATCASLLNELGDHTELSPKLVFLLVVPNR